MHLTRFSDIGLRTLLYLDHSNASRKPVTVAEIALQFNIPSNHLVKVVGHLARAGWIQTTRGRNGGIALCVDSSALKIGIVLRELEGEAELANCEGLQCRLRKDCKLRAALKVGLDAFYTAMNAYSLKDLSSGKTGEQLVQLHTLFLRQSLSVAT